MAKSIYDGGKRRRHFTLSDQGYAHLTAIAQDGGISRSETLERLVRSTDISDGSSLLSDAAWPFVIDHCSSL
jgi:hypothetical protein